MTSHLLVELASQRQDVLAARARAHRPRSTGSAGPGLGPGTWHATGGLRVPFRRFREGTP